MSRGATEDQTKLAINNSVDKAEAKRLIDLCNKSTIMTLTPPKASDELTGRMHCAIRCVANQATLYGEKLTEDEWKAVFVAAMYGQKTVRFNDRYIVVQKQTRGMSGPQKYDVTELVYAWGSENGVEFDDDPNEQMGDTDAGRR